MCTLEDVSRCRMLTPMLYNMLNKRVAAEDSRLDEWISAYRLKSADASSPAHRNSKKAITTSRSRGGVKEPTMAQVEDMIYVFKIVDESY